MNKKLLLVSFLFLGSSAASFGCCCGEEAAGDPPTAVARVTPKKYEARQIMVRPVAIDRAALARDAESKQRVAQDVFVAAVARPGLRRDQRVRHQRTHSKSVLQMVGDINKVGEDGQTDFQRALMQGRFGEAHNLLRYDVDNTLTAESRAVALRLVEDGIRGQLKIFGILSQGGTPLVLEKDAQIRLLASIVGRFGYKISKPGKQGEVRAPRPRRQQRPDNPLAIQEGDEEEEESDEEKEEEKEDVVPELAQASTPSLGVCHRKQRSHRSTDSWSLSVSRAAGGSGEHASFNVSALQEGGGRVQSGEGFQRKKDGERVVTGADKQ